MVSWGPHQYFTSVKKQPWSGRDGPLFRRVGVNPHPQLSLMFPRTINEASSSFSIIFLGPCSASFHPCEPRSREATHFSRIAPRVPDGAQMRGRAIKRDEREGACHYVWTVAVDGVPAFGSPCSTGLAGQGQSGLISRGTAPPPRTERGERGCAWLCFPACYHPWSHRSCLSACASQRP